MKDGICPKCDSEEVFKHQMGSSLVIFRRWFQGSNPVTYICADCGYVETYVEQRNELEAIRKQWTSANAKHKRKNDE